MVSRVIAYSYIQQNRLQQLSHQQRIAFAMALVKMPKAGKPLTSYSVAHQPPRPTSKAKTIQVAKAITSVNQQVRASTFSKEIRSSLNDTTTIDQKSRLHDYTQPKILAAIGALTAVSAGLGILTAKVGPVMAGHLAAQHAIAFLTPGAVITASALQMAVKATAVTTANAVMPFVIPMISTMVVATIVTLIGIYVVYRALDAMKQTMYRGFAAIGNELDKSFIGSAVKATALAVYSVMTASAESEEEDEEEISAPVVQEPARVPSPPRYSFSPMMTRSEERRVGKECRL